MPAGAKCSDRIRAQAQPPRRSWLVNPGGCDKKPLTYADACPVVARELVRRPRYGLNANDVTAVACPQRRDIRFLLEEGLNLAVTLYDSGCARVIKHR